MNVLPGLINDGASDFDIQVAIAVGAPGSDRYLYNQYGIGKVTAFHRAITGSKSSA